MRRRDFVRRVSGFATGDLCFLVACVPHGGVHEGAIAVSPTVEWKHVLGLLVPGCLFGPWEVVELIVGRTCACSSRMQCGHRKRKERVQFV